MECACNSWRERTVPYREPPLIVSKAPLALRATVAHARADDKAGLHVTAFGLYSDSNHARRDGSFFHRGSRGVTSEGLTRASASRRL